MAIIIKPEDIDWSKTSITLNPNTITFRWAKSSTATTKDVEMSNAEHQVHVVSNDETEEIQIECWTCTGFPVIKRFGKQPTAYEVWVAACEHTNG